MFALPEAKRVRREDLNNSDASSSDGEDDIQAREELEAQIARSLGIDVSVSQRPAIPKALPPLKKHEVEDQDVEMEQADPEEYDFCLFGGSAAPTTTKVILEDDSEPKGDGAILTNRPSSYYLARQHTTSEKERLLSSAMTFEDIIHASHRRAWADELPWKVTHITQHTGPSASQQTQEDEKKRRPGKKRRLAIKVKERKKQEKEVEKVRKKEEKEKREGDKEEFIKEKKKRLNRLRKLKRREKAREERRARGEVVDDGEDDAEGNSESE